MLTHKILTKDKAQASKYKEIAEYYEDAIDDYYAKEGDFSSWACEGAKELGLEGRVYEDKFRELLAGIVDESGKNTRHFGNNKKKERLGVDLTFSAPKSVSLHALINRDHSIVIAHEKAVNKALEAAESMAELKIKKNNKEMVVSTNKIVAAKFRHETSREKDPQLHTHAIVMNLTQREDGQWRSLKNDKIIKSTVLLGSIYNNELAKNLQELGHALHFGKDGNFEIAGISKSQLDAFSKRSAMIVEELEKKGLTRETSSAKQKQVIALSTRKEKEEVDREELFNEWKKEAGKLGISFEKQTELAKQQLLEKQSLSSKEVADKSVAFAIEHLTERQSVVSRKDLVNVAMKHSVGTCDEKEILQALSRAVYENKIVKEETLYKASSCLTNNKEDYKTDEEWTKLVLDTTRIKSNDIAASYVEKSIISGRLIPMEPRYTTPLTVKREKNILALELEGRNTLDPIALATRTKEDLAKCSFNSQQYNAASTILFTKNMVCGIQGSAGVGKSYLLNETKKIMEKNNFTIKALAPYATQVRALRELGVESNTLASFLKAKEKNINEKTVLIIDEAGTVPTRQMEEVLKIAKENNSRVVLVGDMAQTKAVEAGSPFELLQKGGMQTAIITEIQRQKNAELKIAVELAAAGDVKESFKKIKDVKVFDVSVTRHKEIAERYVNLPETERDNAVVITGQNDARKNITREIRKGLNLNGTGEVVTFLERHDSTRAERKFAKNYIEGDVIKPERDYDCGLKRDHLYQVTATGHGNRLSVRRLGEEILETKEVEVKDEKTGIVYKEMREEYVDRDITFNPQRYSHISVYHKFENELAVGDQVRITRNDAEKDLANGDKFKVSAIENGVLTLKDDQREIQLDATQPLHVAHAYVTTIHSAQGITCDKVIADLDSKSKTTAKDIYYTAISRARHNVEIYTDDEQRLPFSIEKENIKYNAKDLKIKSEYESYSVGLKRKETTHEMSI